ncbi:CoA pyrophosphatase [Rhizorhapis suberifaciens]|uniref:8-oxo-dGTP pyrophosphatase MutT (NUDIX family) n=1 Tax=Rhizorhapis suberifaciens TaxID=13656 RepID=A0A840HRW7_9SPHN|nr:CoA pyrophosphatase [Rhizorhapis suberifaciens]MBB4640286.1 8-oxo-dGTP pyrophosphatase MutT (NUDIX family) [Rhizorhapis suberifaciens]
MTLADRLRQALRRGHEGGPLIPADMHDPRLGPEIVLAPAAVLIPVTDRPQPGLILTQRTAHLRKHPGQVAFPGGRVDETDADEIDAALREAEEEIALPRAMVEVIGVSDRYHTFTGFDIAPVLAVVPPDLPLVPHAHEVADWFEMPLEYALDPNNQVQRFIEYQGANRPYYEILWEDRRIWGVTAAILVNLRKRLGW